MSLRMKFITLISGSIIIPIVVFAISYRAAENYGAWRDIKSLYSPHSQWRSALRGDNLKHEQLSDIINDIPEIADVQIFDASGSLIAARPSPSFDISSYEVSIREKITLKLSSGSSGYAAISFPYPRFIVDNKRFLITLTVLLFVALIAILIVHSISHSISLLERATRRIAEGDLDFKLPQKRGTDKFASLIRSFDSMRAHLKEEYARRSRFIMGISHDLKTPLSSISGYVDAIRDGYADTPEKLEKYISIIEGKTDLLGSRISMLIDFIKRDTDEWKLSLNPIDIGSFLVEF